MASTLFFILLLLLTSTLTTQARHSRRILHQPFFPLTSLAPTSQPPQSQPPQQRQEPPPKYPFSSQTPPNTQKQFFPSYPSPPPPPSKSSLPTFPANISSLILPNAPSSSKPISKKLVAIAVSVSLLSAALIAAVAATMLHHHHHHRTGYIDKNAPRSDSLRLFPPDTAASDKPPPPQPPHPPRSVSTTSSSEFLYLGTLSGLPEKEDQSAAFNSGNAGGGSSSGYHKLGSPELHPLPPLPRHHSGPNIPTAVVGSAAEDSDNDNCGEEEFFSPRGSSGSPQEGIGSGNRRVSPAAELEPENLRSRSSNSRTASYASSNSVSPSQSMSSSPSVAFNISPRSLRSKSPDSVVNFPAPDRPIPPPLAREPRAVTSSPPPGRDSVDSQNSPEQDLQFGPKPTKSPPPAPPLPPLRFWENLSRNSGPPELVTPSSNAAGLQNPALNLEMNEEVAKPKLKPLHWDKVRASSDRAMVWDQLKSSSFQLNEEMIETLFMVNNLTPKDGTPRPVLPTMNLENRVLDPKKSQNIAILLRALNVTNDEVCEALSEGISDTLGAELLESLLKMAPTKEEEQKLKDFKDVSPVKLGPAEKFLKAVLDIPFAFKRVDAMLYIANFDSEVEYLKRSFETVEAACEELKNSRMLMKLLEAVLKTGNRMNVGTNRGDAHAFKLDTLLKLVDVKGTDGKTTLLHFVVQEIIRAEGSRLSGANQRPVAEKIQQSDLRDDVEFRKLGLQVVSGLSGELTNVKKAAAMESDVLISEVTILATGITKIVEVVKLNEELALRESSRKFSVSMTGFLKKAEEEITKIQAQESVALSMVKEITEYFHGSSVREEAHPFRIFMVVRDFLSTLDQVCKEVGKINERTTVSRQFPLPVNQSVQPVFPIFTGMQQDGSSDDENSSPA
ncbi:hypothetical protein RJ639_011562 [Escallonia herrerae]|uniref:Formin-like protein n=1 Tax=Escallonia herrerae TaxID=1293975 RepID=A0AA88VLZ7_9ASTE|nr:hypothetical protein RJ639_011562 [Escallonia herrerae]